jgi:hypothetical protein
MVNIFGRLYYIDIDAITDKCRIGTPPKPRKRTVKPEASDEEDGEQAINIFKYELIKLCIERVLNEFIEDDSKMGDLSMDGSSVSFKIAFNTLIKNDILIEYE